MAKKNTVVVQAPSTLKALPKLPSLPKLKAKVNYCECGCRGLTGNRFVPGHDARLKGWQIRITRTDANGDTLVQWNEIPSGEREAVAASLGRTKEMLAAMRAWERSQAKEVVETPEVEAAAAEVTDDVA